MIEANKNTVRAFVEAVNAKDWSRLRQVVAVDFRRHSVAAGRPGVASVEDLIHFLEQEYSTFPDACETIEDMLAEDDKVAVRHRFRGIQTGPLGPLPPTGKRLDATYLAIYRLHAGQIVEVWAEWDNMAGLRQLGHHGAA